MKFGMIDADEFIDFLKNRGRWAFYKSIETEMVIFTQRKAYRDCSLQLSMQESFESQKERE